MSANATNTFILVENSNKSFTTLEIIANDENMQFKGSSNQEIDKVIKHLNRLNGDLNDYEPEKCQGCFRKYCLDKIGCIICKRSIYFYNRRRCPICYNVLCKECFQYANDNLYNYMEIICKYLRNKKEI